MDFSRKIIHNINDIQLQNTDLFLIHWFKMISGKSGKTMVTRKEHHHNFIEMHFFLSGYCKYDFNGKIITVSKNQYLMISELENHKVIDISDDFTKLSVGFELKTENNNYNFSFLHSDFNDEIIKFIDYTINESTNPNAFSDDLIRNKLFEILLNILYQNAERPKKTNNRIPDEDIRLEKAKKFISDNISNSLTGKDIAQYCYLSERQLNRIFTNHEGVTVLKYIHAIKLQIAKDFLENTNKSLREISERSGFNNEYYFNRFFKEHVGMPPNEYRISLNKSKSNFNKFTE